MVKNKLLRKNADHYRIASDEICCLQKRRGRRMQVMRDLYPKDHYATKPIDKHSNKTKYILIVKNLDCHL